MVTSGRMRSLAADVWTVGHASWVVTLHSPKEEIFSGKTLEEALAWCLGWLMAPELRIGPFVT